MHVNPTRAGHLILHAATHGLIPRDQVLEDSAVHASGVGSAVGVHLQCRSAHTLDPVTPQRHATWTELLDLDRRDARGKFHRCEMCWTWGAFPQNPSPLLAPYLDVLEHLTWSFWVDVVFDARIRNRFSSPTLHAGARRVLLLLWPTLPPIDDPAQAPVRDLLTAQRARLEQWRPPLLDRLRHRLARESDRVWVLIEKLPLPTNGPDNTQEDDQVLLAILGEATHLTDVTEALGRPALLAQVPENLALEHRAWSRRGEDLSVLVPAEDWITAEVVTTALHLDPELNKNGFWADRMRLLEAVVAAEAG